MIFGKILVISIAFGVIVSTDSVCTKNGANFQEGQTISVPGHCMQVTCEDSATNRQSGITCSYRIPRRGCHMSTTNYAMPYPQCCPIEAKRKEYATSRGISIDSHYLPSSIFKPSVD